MQAETKGLGYWRDVALIALGVFSLVAGFANFQAWRASHASKDLKIALGILLLFPLLFVLTRRRFELLLGILFAIVLLGTVGTILQRSPAALPIIIPCAILVYVLLKWKGKQLRP
jgi:hypothetical protein